LREPHRLLPVLIHASESNNNGIDNGITSLYTSYMKTAISVPDEVFREVDRVARERNSSRSEVIVTAVKEYLERRKSDQLLNTLNQAYGTAETNEEYEVRKKTKKKYASTLRRERS
jgi:predicted transcriptional regulator